MDKGKLAALSWKTSIILGYTWRGILKRPTHRNFLAGRDFFLNSAGVHLCCTRMRTTLVLKDELMIEAKKRAAERRSNVSAIVNEALMAAFRSSPNAGSLPPFQMPTFRPAADQGAQTSPAEFDELLVAEDFEPYQS